MKDPDKMSERELRAEIKYFREVIKASSGLKCPNCDDEGFTVEAGQAQSPYSEHGDDFELVQVQCQFCYEIPDSIFMRSQKSPPAPIDVAIPVEYEFIYTVPGRNTSPQMCYRKVMLHTPMDRWVRCHLVGDRVVLGVPAKKRQVQS